MQIYGLYLIKFDENQLNTFTGSIETEIAAKLGLFDRIIERIDAIENEADYENINKPRYKMINCINQNRKIPSSYAEFSPNTSDEPLIDQFLKSVEKKRPKNILSVEKFLQDLSLNKVKPCCESYPKKNEEASNIDKKDKYIIRQIITVSKVPPLPPKIEEKQKKVENLSSEKNGPTARGFDQTEKNSANTKPKIFEDSANAETKENEKIQNTEIRKSSSSSRYFSANSFSSNSSNKTIKEKEQNFIITPAKEKSSDQQKYKEKFDSKIKLESENSFRISNSWSQSENSDSNKKNDRKNILAINKAINDNFLPSSNKIDAKETNNSTKETESDITIEMHDLSSTKFNMNNSRSNILNENDLTKKKIKRVKKKNV